jgi:hypothetical protein
MLALDQSYTIDFPLWQQTHLLTATPSSGSDSSFLDAYTFTDCTRTSSPVGQTTVDDSPA